jgi:hypothetical protein
MTLLLAAALAAVPADDAWKTLATVDTDAGPMVVSTTRGTDAVCWQAAVHTEATMASLKAVVTDQDHAARWSTAHLVESRTLSRDGASFTYLQHMSPPSWTLTQDRFWVAEGTLTTGGDGVVRMQWHRVSAADAAPDVHARLAEDAVEVPVNEGEWRFMPDATGVDVRYRACTDPGGSLPTWLQRIVSRRTLPQQVAAVVGEARRRSTGT